MFMRKGTSFLMGVLAALPATVLPALDCPQDPSATLAPAIHLTSKPLKPRYFHDHSTAQIAAMRRQWYAARLTHTPGLTMADNRLDSRLKLQGMSHGKNGPVCAWVVSVNVDFSWTRMDVYISSKYPRGSCPYQVILAHENQHVAINTAAFEKYKALMLRALLSATDLPTKANPMMAPSMRQAKAILSSRVNGIVMPLYTEFKQELLAENAKIDTPENYKRTQALCPQW